MEYYIAERMKEFLPFMTAWMELESIMVSEISQAVKGKYHMIDYLFYFADVSLAVQMLFILMKFGFFILSFMSLL